MSLKRGKIIGIGPIEISKEKADEYKSVIWKDLVYTIGEKIVDSYKEELSSKKFRIFFFPKGNMEKTEDFVAKINTSITTSLFHIQYNKNLQAINCKKVENEIPTQLVFLILE